MQLVGFEPSISPFILFLWEEEVYFEVELIHLGETIYSWAKLRFDNLGLICAEIGLFMLIEASSFDLFLM